MEQITERLLYLADFHQLSTVTLQVENSLACDAKKRNTEKINKLELKNTFLDAIGLSCRKEETSW
jgi:hypothetical protein